MSEKLTIALAGVGDLGRYLLEELSDDRYHVVVLTSQVSKPLPENPHDHSLTLTAPTRKTKNTTTPTSPSSAPTTPKNPSSPSSTPQEPTP